MNDTLSSYTERRERAAERLRAALDPRTDAEHRRVEWLLSNLIPNEADDWSAMVERAVARARAEGYDKGFAEGSQ